MTNKGTAAMDEQWLKDWWRLGVHINSRDKLAERALDSLRSRMTQLEDALRMQPSQDGNRLLDRLAVAEAKLTQVEQERDVARGIVIRFGRHERSCDLADPLLVPARSVGVDVKCSCGFAEELMALSSLETEQLPDDR